MNLQKALDLTNATVARLIRELAEVRKLTDDLIQRSDVLEILEREMKAATSTPDPDWGLYNGLKRMIILILALPSVSKEEN